MSFTTTQGPPSVTHYLAVNHDGDALDAYRDVYDECYFCGHSGAGLPAAEVISEDYFSDHPLRQKPDSDVVCAYCAYSMDHRGLKQGHWLATGTEFRSVSTGDLLELFREIQAGEVEPPLAVHVSENPIRSEHAYLWTPVVHSTAPLLLSYGRESVLLEWDEFDRLLNAVEELRWYGFRGDDIRSGEPRVRNLAAVGADRYWTLNERIEPHRGTPLFEVVWTVSRSKDNQPQPPRSATHDDNTIRGP
jgi:hypothetical protein